MVAAVGFGCGAPPNTAYLPVGSRCERDDQCGTQPYICNTNPYPGGYCEKTCSTDGDCPSDAVCVGARSCRRKCKSNAECRITENPKYACIDRLATSFVCDYVP
jgi:hypothetical protein